MRPGLSSVTCSSRAELMRMAAAVNWAPGDRERVLSSLAEKPKGVRKGRRSMQSWAPALLGYFTLSEWTSMLEVKSTEFHQNILFSRLIALGCRTPSEHTLKCLASVLLLLQYGDSQKCTLMPSGKHAFLSNVKRSYKQRIRNMDDPDTHMLVLHGQPSDFQREHPAWFAKIYADGAPVHCPLDLMELQAIEQSYGCRSGRVAQMDMMKHGGENAAISAMLSTLISMQQQSQCVLQMNTGRGQQPRCLAGLSSNPLQVVGRPQVPALADLQSGSAEGSQSSTSDSQPSHGCLALAIAGKKANADPIDSRLDSQPSGGADSSLQAQAHTVGRLAIAAPSPADDAATPTPPKKRTAQEMLDDYLAMEKGSRIKKAEAKAQPTAVSTAKGQLQTAASAKAPTQKVVQLPRASPSATSSFDASASAPDATSATEAGAAVEDVTGSRATKAVVVPEAPDASASAADARGASASAADARGTPALEQKRVAPEKGSGSSVKKSGCKRAAPEKGSGSIVKKSDCKRAAPEEGSGSVVKKSDFSGKTSKPNLSHEGTRCQYLVRSGPLGEPSSAFRYKPGDEASKQEAKAKADALLAVWQGKLAK